MHNLKLPLITKHANANPPNIIVPNWHVSIKKVYFFFFVNKKYNPKYKSKKILLKVLLEDEKKYSFKEVEKIIDDYLKKGVK